MLEEKGLADSIEHVRFENINAINSKKNLEFFFDILMQNDSKLIGGKLPNEDFYYKWRIFKKYYNKKSWWWTIKWLFFPF